MADPQRQKYSLKGQVVLEAIRLKKERKRNLCFFFSTAQWYSDASLLNCVCIDFSFLKILSPPYKSIYCLANKHIMHNANLQIDGIEESVSLLARDHILLIGKPWWWKAVYNVWYMIHYVCYIVREWRYGQMGEKERAGIQILRHLSSLVCDSVFSLIKIGNWFVLINVISVHKDIAVILPKCY